ncbi:translation initiation factor IF-3-like isoform X2 [Artemia franciscana]|uniref:translation initiation factor IF-3-like isoform X2 n=1 Tax=Artemia franciscana TaxID=6661 RepID=UPI0032DB61D5
MLLRISVSMSCGRKALYLVLQLKTPSKTLCFQRILVLQRTIASTAEKFKHIKIAQEVVDSLKTEPISVDVVLEHGKIVTMKLYQAEKYAKTRDLKLMPIKEHNRPIQLFKLVTGSEFFKYEMEQKHAKKAEQETKHHEKRMNITCKIEDHDLYAKLNQVKKWLTKNIKTEVTISFRSNEEDKAESTLSRIEQYLKSEGKIHQKRVKNNLMKFFIIPASSEK